MVGSTELVKREHENKTAGETFRVPFTFASSPLSESLEQATITRPVMCAFSLGNKMTERNQLSRHVHFTLDTRGILGVFCSFFLVVSRHCFAASRAQFRIP